jgi:hypothetical protein
MSERIAQELAMLRTCWPDLEYLEAGHWVQIPEYPVPDGLWKIEVVEVCFQIPEQLPGQAPYGFHVRPGLLLREGDAPPANYTHPVETPFGEGWGRFSWSPREWKPAADPTAGSNMVDFAWSFAERLRQGQ